MTLDGLCKYSLNRITLCSAVKMFLMTYLESSTNVMDQKTPICSQRVKAECAYIFVKLKNPIIYFKTLDQKNFEQYKDFYFPRLILVCDYLSCNFL